MKVFKLCSHCELIREYEVLSEYKDIYYIKCASCGIIESYIGKVEKEQMRLKDLTFEEKEVESDTLELQ